jgi:hypothetical protein
MIVFFQKFHRKILDYWNFGFPRYFQNNSITVVVRYMAGVGTLYGGLVIWRIQGFLGKKMDFFGKI